MDYFKVVFKRLNIFGAECVEVENSDHKNDINVLMLRLKFYIHKRKFQDVNLTLVFKFTRR